MSNLAEELSSLMRAANAGDAGAYRTLLQSLAGRLRITVRRALAGMGRGPEEAEDIVQETLLAIHLKRHTWDDQQPLEPWARGIARYKMIDALRRRGFADHKPIDDFAEFLAAPEADEVGMLATRDLLAKLPERDRHIVQAVSIEGRSAKEAGAALGMTEGAIRVALHRALKALAVAAREGEA